MFINKVPHLIESFGDKIKKLFEWDRAHQEHEIVICLEVCVEPLIIWY